MPMGTPAPGPPLGATQGDDPVGAVCAAGSKAVWLSESGPDGGASSSPAPSSSAFRFGEGTADKNSISPTRYGNTPQSLRSPWVKARRGRPKTPTFPLAVPCRFPTSCDLGRPCSAPVVGPPGPKTRPA